LPSNSWIDTGTALIPGSVKWSGILHFPIIDSYERPRLKWLCLYFHGDRMYGYDPAARYESERQFAVPIRFEDRLQPAVLATFAASYVQSIFPGGEELYESDPDPDSGDFGGELQFFDVPPGRIAAVFPADHGLPPIELVKMIYQYTGTADPTASATMGPPADYAAGRLSWREFWQKVGTAPDYVEVARQLVAPRWGQKVIFHYMRDRWLLGEKPAQQTVLLFNVGLRVFSYHPDYGVWRTDATIHDLADARSLPAKLRFPGVPRIQRVEFIQAAGT
jgi:hypothetical protein